MKIFILLTMLFCLCGVKAEAGIPILYGDGEEIALVKELPNGRGVLTRG